MSKHSDSNDASLDGAPWYRFPLVWMVLGGPGIVVVASFVTLWLALATPDPVIDEDYYRKGLEINQQLRNKDLMPAIAGRNHAATPSADVPTPGR